MSFSTTVTIKTFPVELLTIIFCFVGPSSLSEPYPYLPLCWVCHRWRDIVLNDSKFWSVLDISRDMNWGLNNEVIHRSNSRALDIIISRQMERRAWNTYHINPLSSLSRFAYNNDQLRTRVRSLFFSNSSATLYRKLSQWFPQLERFTGSSSLDVQDGECLIPIITASERLRYADLPWDTLSSCHSQKLLPRLSRLEWLVTSLRVTEQPANSVLSEILESLPNLQILILSQKKTGRYFDLNNDISKALITLPKLRLLSLDFDIGKSWTFHAPNLDYLCVLNLGGERFHDWNLLENIDFSKINNILIGNHTCTKIVEKHIGPDLVRTYPPFGSFACISGSEHPQLDCLPYETFHSEGLESQAAVDDHLDLPTKNSFHLSMPCTDLKAFDVVLKRVTNLVELTVNYRAIKSDTQFSFFLGRILDDFGRRITRLNMVQGRSFVEACNLLANGRRLPSLEQLMYHNEFTIKRTAFLPNRVEKLQNARLDAGSSPLEILELENFAVIPSEEVQKIEDLGIHLVQTA